MAGAVQNIMLKIGSAFDGEGFKRAQRGVGELNNGIRGAMGVVGGFSAVLGGIDTSAAKAIGAVSGMIGTLVSLNAAAILSQGIMLAFTAKINKCTKEIEELQKKSADLKASVDAAFNKTLSASVSDVHDEMKSIVGDFDRITAQANAFTAALNGLNASAATGGIIDLEIEKVNAVMEAETEQQRKLVAAEYDLEIATRKAADSRQAWEGKIAAADKAIEDNGKRVALYDEQRAALSAKIAELEEDRIGFLEVDKTKAKAIADEIAKLKAEEAQLAADQNVLREKAKALEVTAQTVRQDAVNADKQMTLATMNATAKINDLKAAAEAAAKAEKEAAAKQAEENRIKEEKAAAAKEEKDALQQGKDAQSKANDAARQLADAEQAYADAIAAYMADFAGNQIRDSIFGANTMKGGMSAPMAIGKGIVDGVVAHEKAERLKNGGFGSVRQMNEFDRDRSKQLAQDARRENFQLMKEKQQYDKLVNTPAKLRSDADKKFMRDFEALQDAQNKKRQDIIDKEKALQDAQEADRKAREDLHAIRQKLDKLGLK